MPNPTSAVPCGKQAKSEEIARVRKAMDPKPSVMDMLARLEEQIAHNAEREAFHAGHEAFHRDQRRSYGCQPRRGGRH
jgi:hypothetical protein